jgi:copper chaperone CopZ
MKTSVIEVHDMLSVLSVDEVERRIGDVPGVESVTVNFAAASATVRYDETRLTHADIKSSVRQRAHDAAASAGDGHEGHTAAGAPPATPAPAASSTAPVAPAPTGSAPRDTAGPSTPPDPSSATADTPAASAAHAGHEQKGKTAPEIG